MLCHLLSSQPQRWTPRESRQKPNPLLPMLSTPRGMITSAYFLVCKTAMVWRLKGKSQLDSRERLQKQAGSKDDKGACALGHRVKALRHGDT